MRSTLFVLALVFILFLAGCTTAQKTAVKSSCKVKIMYKPGVSEVQEYVTIEEGKAHYTNDKVGKLAYEARIKVEKVEGNKVTLKIDTLKEEVARLDQLSSGSSTQVAKGGKTYFNILTVQSIDCPAPVPQPPSTQCSQDSDCKNAKGKVCEEGRCVAPPECKEDDDCKKSGLFCIGGNCEVKSCKTDEGCGKEGYICESNICKKAECSQDNDCKDKKWKSCQNSRCAPPPECKEDSDCGKPGLVCQEGKCEAFKERCEDVDDPDDILDKRGLVIANNKNYPDECADKTRVRQFSCFDNKLVISKPLPCNKGHVCSDGACVSEEAAEQPSCQDDDQNNLPDRKGVVIVDNQKYYDSCAGKSTVVEYGCSDGKLVEKPIDCDPGLVCSDGICTQEIDGSKPGGELPSIVEPEPDIEPEPRPSGESFCTDTDGGEVLSTRGTARDGIRENGQETRVREKTDECKGVYKVYEYLCDSGSLIARELECPSGQACDNGQCVDAESVEFDFCTDSDIGKDYKTKGTTEAGRKTAADTILSSEKFEDKCVDEQTIKEYYCSDTSKTGVEAKCPAGEKCVDGACISKTASACEETDDGKNINKKGTTEVKQNSFVLSIDSDSCVDEKTVNEFYCDNGTRSVEAVVCAEDQICKDGECVAKPPEKKSLTIQLNKGWNLFSIPFDNAQISSTCEGFTPVETWHYDITKWIHPSSLEAGKGYWFNSKTDCSISVQGDNFDINDLELKKGWNQIGSSSEKEEFSELLKSCDVTFDTRGYNAGTKKYVKAEKNIPGEGYFVQVGSECKLE